jgi:DNA adenine methylase
MDGFQSSAPAWRNARPLLKWTGGKSAELPIIQACLPPQVDRLLEPFVGGGAVLFAAPSTIHAEVNDLSGDLVTLYRAMAEVDPLLWMLARTVTAAWDAVGKIEPGRLDSGDLTAAAVAAAAPLTAVIPQLSGTIALETMRALGRKNLAMARIEGEGREVVDPGRVIGSALKAGTYTAIRQRYNTLPAGIERSVLFWFLREFCYGGMFRTNAGGGFNVPYGGMSYDNRSMQPRLDQLASPAIQARLAATRFHQGDFSTFLERVNPQSGDFLFADPPYDSPFSTYDGNSFTRGDHLRLASALAALPCNWMVVISETDFVKDCYCHLPGTSVLPFTKGYAANIKQRFERSVTHLVITSYSQHRRAPGKENKRIPGSVQIAA